MKKLLRKSNLVACVLVLTVVCLGIVFASDVVVKQGKIEAESVDANSVIEGDIFKSTGCTAIGVKAVAFGHDTEASGCCSTAMGFYTEASGNFSTAMGLYTTADANYSTAIGNNTKASGENSTVIGSYSEASATSSTAMGIFSKNDISNSFAVGYGVPGSGGRRVDFRVRSELVNVYGDLEVDDKVGIATTSPTAKLDVNSNIIRLRTSKTPASASAAGNAGDICWDPNYIYICVATNTWKRAALSSW